MIKFYKARSLLYRRQILQENIRWKALDEIYKIYMLLHRLDLNISENFRQTFFFRDDASKKSENGRSLENLKIENTRPFHIFRQISSNIFACLQFHFQMFAYLLRLWSKIHQS